VPLLRAHRFGQPQQLQRQRARQRLREVVGATAVGREAGAPIRHREARARGRDHQVAGQHQRTTTARCVPFDGGDHRLGEFAQRLHESVKAIDVGAHLIDWALARGREAIQITSGAEVRTVAAQHHAAQRRIVVERGEHLDSGGIDLRRQRVARGRISDGQHQRVAAAFGEQLGGHATSRMRNVTHDSEHSLMRGAGPCRVRGKSRPSC
jgi:hypothetical protein